MDVFPPSKLRVLAFTKELMTYYSVASPIMCKNHQVVCINADSWAPLPEIPDPVSLGWGPGMCTGCF